MLFPQSFEDIIELLVPELRKRGLFWDDYAVPGGTYRENFYQKPGQKHPPAEHVAAKHHWQPGWMRTSIRHRNEYLVVLGLAEVASTWQRVSSLRLWLLASNNER